ncbi:MAG: hypothetical protein AB6733_23250 [Clostridiaceae bacterium]
MDLFSDILKYVVAIIVYIAFRNITIKFNLGQKIIDVFKVKSSSKIFVLSSISFFLLLVIEISLKFLFSWPDEIMKYYIWVNLGIVSGIGSETINLLKRTKK